MNYTQLITEAHEHQKGKVCTVCNKHLPLNEFSVRKSSKKDGLMWRCRSCVKHYKDNECRFKRWFLSKKSGAKRKGIEFTILPTDIPGVKIKEYTTFGIYNNLKYATWKSTQYPKVCFKWGIELDWGRNGIQYNSPSLDRIDPTKGYVPGNVRLVCNSYNMAKLNCPPDVWDVVEKQIGRAILFGDNK